MTSVYLSYAQHLQQEYGGRIYRIGVDGQFSCPNRNADGSGGCAYCETSGSIAAYQKPQDSVLSQQTSSLEERIEHVLAQIESGKRFLVRRYKAEAFALYFQSYTNTFDTIENLQALYDAALKRGPFVELIISTRPDCLSDEVVDLLGSYTNKVKKVWVELGLQSTNQAALDLVGRNHDISSYIRGVNSLHLHGIGVCTHIMLGLPLDTLNSYHHTARIINSVQSEAVKIHNLHICRNTRMEGWYAQGEITTASVRRHVEETIDMLRHLDSSIIIERMLCETPASRRIAPKDFVDKHQFIRQVISMMEERGWQQGDLV